MPRPYGWMNDPNGMVWYDGEYHLFFQHNPYGSRWENMTWGHSVSRDLLRWEQLPNALEPDSLGAMFSGCCVIDRDNTAGFGRDAMIALYTTAGAPQTQCLSLQHRPRPDLYQIRRQSRADGRRARFPRPQSVLA